MQGIFRVVLSGAALAAATLVSVNALAQTEKAYPTHAITMVIPYPPGATTDLLGRMVADGMREELGQSVVVENRGGASGNIGSAHLAKAAPDGYTIGIGTDATHGGSNFFLAAGKAPDPIKEFTPISLAAKNILVLVAHPSFQPNNIQELIEYAKKNPGKLSFGSSGTGSPHHLAGALLNDMAGINMVHVPYKGGGQAVIDVLGGQIPLIFASLASVDSHIKSGKLKVLGVTEKTRYPGLPDVPAIGETVKGFDMESWLAIFAPANTPRAVVDKLNAAVVKTLGTAKVRDKLNSMGLLVVGSSAGEMASMQAAYVKSSGALIKSQGIKAE